MQALQNRKWLTDQYLRLDISTNTEQDTAHLLAKIKYLKAANIPFTVVLSGATEEIRKKLSSTLLSFPVMTMDYLSEGGLSCVSTLEGGNEEKEILKTPLDTDHTEVFEQVLNPLVYARLARIANPHPRLARIKGISRFVDFRDGTENNLISISEEFVDAEGTMEDFLNVENGITDTVSRKLSHEEKGRLFLELLSAVDFLNRKGIIHRDTKPNNILLVQDKDGQLHVKVIDFGISKLAGDKNDASKNISGTVNYMPLTDATENEVTKNYDIYSLGRIAVRMFYPEIWKRFTANGVNIYNMMNGIPEALRQINTDSPDKEISDCIIRMLEINSSDRIQTLDTVIRVFGQYFAEEIILDNYLENIANRVEAQHLVMQGSAAA